MKRCFLLALALILLTTGSAFADLSKHTNPWEDVELNAFDLIQDGYRLVSVVWPAPNIEGMYFQKKDRVYRCFTFLGSDLTPNCAILINIPKPVLAIVALKLLATAQENYYADNDIYTFDLEALEQIGFFFSDKVGIKITRADKNSWRGIAFFIEFPEVEYVYDSEKGGLQD